MAKKINVTAALVIVVTGIALICFWRHNPQFRSLHVGEPFVDANQFIPGANFKELGFWNLRFTADYAVGPKEYHPFYYTHNGPLSEIINGIYQKCGLTRIEWQRPVCILWTILGFLFFYLLLKLLAGEGVALWSLIIGVSNPFVFYWGDNLFFSHQWLFICLSLYCLVRHIRNSSLGALFIAWGAFFLAAFSNYELVPLIAIFALGLKLFKIESFPARELLVFLSAPIAAFCLRSTLIIWAVGYNIWSYDLVEILSHRIFGVKTHLMEIYNRVPIVMWDSDAAIPKNFLQLLYVKLENLYGYGWSLLFIALAFARLRRKILPGPDAPRIYRLILLFFIMGTAWFLFFPQHTSAHFHGSTMLLFLPFSCLLWGSVLVGLWQNIRGFAIKSICLLAILGAIAGARIVNFVPPKPFPGIDALPRYEGKVFCTNSIPTLVEYYTKAPAAFCAYENQFQNLLGGKYYFFLKNKGLDLPQPEFFFCVYGWNEPRLAARFPLVERGPGYAIYRLQPR